MRHPTKPAALAALLTVAAAATGCGINDPLNDTALTAPRQHSTRSPNEQGTPGRGRPSRSALKAAASTPTGAIRRFAELYINWNAETLVAHQRKLAAISIGEASSTQARAVARTRADYELRRSQIANEGRVVAIAPTVPPRPGIYMVVTRERTTGTSVYDQLEAAYHLTIATVEQIPGGWAVSQWRPQL
jgi:hypothetical protein